VLILGWGDLLAAREVLAHDFVSRVTVVELDALVLELVRSTSLAATMRGALADPRLAVVIDDALAWLRRGAARFDAIVVDFPDPATPTLAALFARETWALVRDRLAPGGRLCLQASSPLAPAIPASIARSVEAAGLQVQLFKRVIGSAGANAFVVAAHSADTLARWSLTAPATTLADDDALRAMVQPDAAIALALGDVVSVQEPATVEQLAARHAARTG
jgi:spermidine synthase